MIGEQDRVEQRVCEARLRGVCRYLCGISNASKVSCVSFSTSSVGSYLEWVEPIEKEESSGVRESRCGFLDGTTQPRVNLSMTGDELRDEELSLSKGSYNSIQRRANPDRSVAVSCYVNKNGP